MILKQIRPNMTLKQIGPNQTVVSNGNGRFLFSYETPVAAFLCRDIQYGDTVYPSGSYVRTSVKYSVTTSKHINKWIGAGAAQVPQEFFTVML